MFKISVSYFKKVENMEEEEAPPFHEAGKEKLAWVLYKSQGMKNGIRRVRKKANRLRPFFFGHSADAISFKYGASDSDRSLK